MNIKHILRIICMIFVGTLIFFAMYSNLDSIWKNHYDDTYLQYRIAINLASNKGMVYNEGEKTDAATSFVYTVLLATAYKIGMRKMEVPAFIINFISQIYIMVLLYFIIIYITGNIWYAIIAGLCGGLHGILSVWTVLGMETALFTAVMLSFIYSVFISNNNKLITIFFILLCITRPEGILFGVLLFKNKNIKTIVISFIVVALFYILRMWYYDTIIPHSVQMKYITTYTEWKRYVAPLSVLFVIAWTWLAYNLHKYVASVMMVFLIVSTILSMLYVRPMIHLLANQVKLQLKIGEYINKHINEDEIILSFELGAYGYKAINHRFIDGVGLLSSDVLKAYKKGNSIDVILNKKKPVYIADTYHEIGDSLYSKNMHNFDFLKIDIPKSEYLDCDYETILDYKADRNIHFVLLKLKKETY